MKQKRLLYDWRMHSAPSLKETAKALNTELLKSVQGILRAFFLLKPAKMNRIDVMDQDLRDALRSS